MVFNQAVEVSDFKPLLFQRVNVVNKFCVREFC